MTETEQRVSKLRKLMEKMSIDAFLVTDRTNIVYLSNYTGDDGVLLITENNHYIVTDTRFEEQIKVYNPDWQAVMTRNYIQTACELASKEHCHALGFESSISYAEFEEIDEYAADDCDIVSLSNVIENIRSIKSLSEIEKIRKSCQLAREGYRFILNNIESGVTEHQLANELDYFMKKNGASQASFETILASGPRTAQPHGTYTQRAIQNGDLITLDFGYYLEGYTSDVTRTFGFGKQSDEIKKIYEVVLTAQKLTIEAIKPGISGVDLDVVGREYITSQGYGKYFNHGMGHGIGMSIHEAPSMSRSGADEIQAGQIITIEPGIYVPGVGGVRIEDDLLVTDTGYENLTDFDKDFLEV